MPTRGTAYKHQRMGSQGKAHPELPVKLLVHLKLREVLKPPGLPQIDDRRRVLSHPASGPRSHPTRPRAQQHASTVRPVVRTERPPGGGSQPRVLEYRRNATVGTGSGRPSLARSRTPRRAPVRVHRWQASRHSCCCRSWLSLGGLVAGKRRARRDSRDAARRSRPSSSSSSASVAMIATTARPAGVAVSTPSLKARNVIRRSPRSAMVRVTSATDRPSRSIAATTTVSPGRA
jgi:hypothetical protein